MTTKEKAIKELQKISSKGLNIITRKDFDLKKKEKEISEMEMKIEDFESKGFAVEVDKAMLDSLYNELENIDYDKEHIYQEHIIMDEIAIAIGKYNGSAIYTFGEAKSNNDKLKSNTKSLMSEIKSLNQEIEKSEDEEHKDSLRIKIIKNEGIISKIEKLISKFNLEFKDFIDLDIVLDSEIKELQNKVKSLTTKIESENKSLNDLYLDLVDDTKRKEKEGELAQNKIEELKLSISNLQEELPEYEIKLIELSSEQNWLHKQINLPEKDFKGLDSKLKIWEEKKNDIVNILTEMEKTLNVEPKNMVITEGENPLQNILERVRFLSEAMLDYEINDIEEQQFVGEEITYNKDNKKFSVNPFVVSMLALGGYLAFKK
mgnify:FL=1|tara:strand:- start:1861 stop:2985 length:1125 start_codon:yes stop_codon:yes gene_type:complete